MANEYDNGIFKVVNGSAQFASTVAANIEKFNAYAPDYLYDLEPQSQNLFYVGFLGENLKDKIFYNAAYRIQKVTIPDLSLTFEHNRLTRAPVIKEAKWEPAVTIDWIEDVYHSVKKYHDDWARRWYDTASDCFRCGYSGKFRFLDLVAYHYVEVPSNDSLLARNAKLEPLFVYRLGGMVPTRVPGMTFDYNNDSNAEKLTVEYKCAKIEWRYNSDITVTNWDSVGSEKAWDANGLPSSFVGNYDRDEHLRIARAAVTTYDSLPPYKS